MYLTYIKDEAVPYTAYFAVACKAVGAEWHYADSWKYDENGVPLLIEKSPS